MALPWTGFDPLASTLIDREMRAAKLITTKTSQYQRRKANPMDDRPRVVGTAVVRTAWVAVHLENDGLPAFREETPQSVELPAVDMR